MPSFFLAWGLLRTSWAANLRQSDIWTHDRNIFRQLIRPSNLEVKKNGPTPAYLDLFLSLCNNTENKQLAGSSE